MNEEKEPVIYHKILPGKKYRVWKTTFNDMDFYKVQTIQKNYDGTKEIYYIELKFKKNVEIPNETDIIIKCAYENFGVNKKDKYHPILYYVVTDFEICKRQEQIEKEALNDFQQTLYENENEEDIFIDDNFLD